MKSAFYKELEDLLNKAPREFKRVSFTIPVATEAHLKRVMLRKGKYNRSALITKLIEDYIQYCD